MKWRITNYKKSYEGVDGKFNVNLYLPPTNPTTVNASDPTCYGYLYITLKVFYEKDDTGDGLSFSDENKKKFHAAAWPDSEWTAYKKKVKELSDFWDAKFWLVLGENYKDSSQYKNVEKYIALYMDADPAPTGKQILVYPRTICCKFDLQLLDSSKDAHKHIKVAYIVNNDTNTATGIDTFTSRSNSEYYDNGDLVSASNGYNTIIHELGHAIGLPHIGVVTSYQPCLDHDHWYRFWDSEGTNHATCYEGPLKTDIMGSGGGLDWRDAIPWRFAFQEMTGIPLEFYLVQQHPMVTQSSELITEGTPRWAEFHGYHYDPPTQDAGI